MMNIFSKLFSIYGFSTVYFSIGSIIFYLISITEPSNYIDEIFHVNQCLKYCEGNFYEYDPKITTPPALYIITAGILLPLSKFTRIRCSVVTFRSISFIFSQLLFILIYRILNQQIHSSYSNKIKCWMALNLCFFPVLYFYSFFYYTDIVSTFFILLTYHLYNVNASHSAGLTGLVSVTIRQTNIVWFCSFVFMKCCTTVEKEISKAGRSIPESEKQKLSYFLIILKESLYLTRHSFRHFALQILTEVYLFILTMLGFLYLLIKNGSLVLGDKSAHQAVIHLPQLLYFALFTSVFAFPLCIYPSIQLLCNIRRLKCKLFFYTFLLVIVVSTNTMAHLFLISDNRHYTFYIWQRIFQKSFGKFIMIPLYIASIYSILYNTSHVNACSKFAYLISTVACLVPQKLLEFRYFIIPYLFYRIGTCSRLSQWQLKLEFAFSLLVNYLTISIFLQKPFQWPDGSIQRFSW